MLAGTKATQKKYLYHPHSGNRPGSLLSYGPRVAYSRNAGMFVQAGIVIFSEWPKNGLIGK
jgi:hypothetical protein